MMTFINAPALALLVLIPLGVIFLIWRGRARRQALLSIGDPALVERLTEEVSGARRIIKSGLWLITLAALIFALARPVWGVDLDVIETQGAAVMVVLDVSISMNAQDILPSRLERAKLSIRDLFIGLEGNEVGLVLFAGVAYVQFPLTTDTRSAETFLSAANSLSVSRQGTEIDEALRVAIQSLDTRATGERMILLMSDGENQEGDALSAADEAAALGITIHAIGYGDPVDGAPMPVYDAAGVLDTYKADPGGNVILSRLDETVLQGVAERTGGLYQRGTPSGGEIINLVNQINQAEAGSLESRVEQRGIERFGVFVALALLALSLEILLPERRGAAL